MPPERTFSLLTAACEAAGDVPASLELARRLAPLAAGLGDGGTWDYLTALAGLGAVDLTTARVVEPHLDALAILAQAGMSPDDLPRSAPGSDVSGASGVWGVYAAESPGTTLTATGSDADGWVLDGVKPWCSLGEHVTHAVVTAGTPDGNRRAFAVLLDEKVRPVEGSGPWVSRGLAAIRSTPLRFEGAPAVPVGGPGWYLTRPGFAWGGIGVAAVWYGAATSLARALSDAAETRTPDQVALAALGSVDAALHAAALTLQDAAAGIEAGEAEGEAGALLAARVRAVVAGAAEETLRTVGQALGPQPLCLDEEHARRVADLTVYVRQHHASRDHARLGLLLLADHSRDRGGFGAGRPAAARA